MDKTPPRPDNAGFDSALSPPATSTTSGQPHNHSEPLETRYSDQGQSQPFTIEELPIPVHLRYPGCRPLDMDHVCLNLRFRIESSHS